MTPFGMKASEAGRAADVFALAQATANLNVEQLGIIVLPLIVATLLANWVNSGKPKDNYLWQSRAKSFRNERNV